MDETCSKLSRMRYACHRLVSKEGTWMDPRLRLTVRVLARLRVRVRSAGA